MVRELAPGAGSSPVPGSAGGFWTYRGDDGGGSPMCTQFMEPVEIDPGEVVPPEFDYDLYAAAIPTRR